MTAMDRLESERNQALAALLFGHEQELLGNLKRFPLVLRYKLDALDVGLPLSAWQQLSYQQRRALTLMPIDSEDERVAMKQMLQGLAQQVCGVVFGRALAEPLANFRDTSQVPAQVAKALAQKGLSISVKRWARLDEMARYGLAKLSREGHENRRLGPLIDDLFGLDAEEPQEAALVFINDTGRGSEKSI
jgi:hypothetical protein